MGPTGSGSEAPAAAQAQARIGPFAVRGVIGAGAMGMVYLAHDPRIDRLVAVKTIRRELLQGEHLEHGITDRFRLEAKISGRLGHRNIVSVYQFGEDAACAWLAMEYVAGRSLRDYLTRPGGLALEEIQCLMVQLLDALDYAHGRGVVHRDIKPANLMVDRDGRLKITDFGIARTESSQLTRSNALVGSPGYMAPEQYQGGAIDRRVDIFAAGVLLFELLSGTSPFPGPEQALMFQVLYEPQRSLVDLLGEPAWAPYDRVLEHALAKDPANRLASAAEFRDVLLALAGRPVPERLRSDRLLPPPALVHALDLPETVTRQTAPPRTVLPETSPPRTAPPSVLPSGFEDPELARLDRDLTHHLGPIARVLVQRALREGHDAGSARVALARSIDDPAARQRFLAGTAVPAPAPARAAFVPSRPAGTQAATPLSEADPAQAVKALLPWLGPVARVVVRRAAGAATTREAFVVRVLEQLAPELDRARVETDLWRALS